MLVLVLEEFYIVNYDVRYSEEWLKCSESHPIRYYTRMVESIHQVSVGCEIAFTNN